MLDHWTPESLARFEERLERGFPIGLGTEEVACVLASVRLALDPSAGLVDALPCAHPTLRRLAIHVNDLTMWDFPERRAAGLRPLAMVLPGTVRLSDAAVLGVVAPLVYALADHAIRVAAPDALYAQDRTGARIQFLRDLPQITDYKSALVVADALSRYYTSQSAGIGMGIHFTARYAIAIERRPGALIDCLYYTTTLLPDDTKLVEFIQQVADGVTKLMEGTEHGRT